MFLIHWRDVSSNWIPLKDIKESNPIEVAEYAVAHKIVEEPAFAWRDKEVLRKRRHILSSIGAFSRTKCTLEEAESGKGLPGYQKISCHLVFDIKMDFSRKARFVAGGHLTDPPASMIYSSVVSREGCPDCIVDRRP